MKNTKLPSLVVLMILTVITVLFWISFSIYRSFAKTVDTPVEAKYTAPIVPSLDLKTVEKVKEKIYP